MDAQDDESALRMTSFSKGKNPFLDQERCLLCNCQRQDPPEAEKILSGKYTCIRNKVHTQSIGAC